MPKVQTTVQWEVADDEAEWEVFMRDLKNPVQLGGIPSRSWRSPRRWLNGAFFLICITVAGVWLLHFHQQQRIIVAAELKSTLEEKILDESETDPLGNQYELTNSTQPISTQPIELDPSLTMAMSDASIAEIHHLDIRDRSVLVEAVVARVAADSRLRKYRIIRAYARADEHWVQTSLTPKMWGGVAALEAEHIRYTFRERDRMAVEAVAPQLDAFYKVGAAYLGLPPQSEKLVINVDITAPSDMNRILVAEAGAFDAAVTVPSPARFAVPAELSNTVFLEQMLYPVVSKHLSDRLSSSMGEDRSERLRWQVMNDALRLWLLWQADGPLAKSSRYAIYHMIGHSIANDHDYPRVSVPEVHRMCKLYQSLDIAPLIMSISVACHQSGGGSYVGWRIPPSLASIGRIGPLHSASTGADESVVTGWSALEETAPLSLVLAYILEAYGAEQVTTFVHAYTQHQGWETLIPAVFGISLAKFQAGWLAYLAEQTG